MAFVPQTHLPGGEAEVDFGDVWVELAGELTKCFLFTLRLSYSGKAVHRVFASQGQEAFIEGHLAAFTVLGGSRPTRSGMTTCARRCPGSCSAGPGPSPTSG